MHSALYLGRVRHRRFEPRPHAFRYPLFMVSLDLDELPRVFQGRWFWSVDRPNLASFRREDYLGPPGRPLADCVRDRVQSGTGVRPEGPIRLLTHLRYFGHCFNPVSFYYCYERDGETLQAIVAEITNTPWKERHSYVLPMSASERPRAPPAVDDRSASGAGPARVGRWHFDKDFHVSPFMPMDVRYDWRFTEPGDALAVHMVCERQGQRTFDASLALQRRPMTAWSMAGALLRYPLMTLQVVCAIHWHALRLWLKRAPVYTHPDSGTLARSGEGGR